MEKISIINKKMLNNSQKQEKIVVEEIVVDFIYYFFKDIIKDDEYEVFMNNSKHLIEEVLKEKCEIYTLNYCFKMLKETLKCELNPDGNEQKIKVFKSIYDLYTNTEELNILYDTSNMTATITNYNQTVKTCMKILNPKRNWLRSKKEPINDDFFL